MKVYELLADSAAWTQRTMARRENGDSVGPVDPDACMWCIAGAVRRLYPGREGCAVLERIRRALELDAIEGVFIWNDNRRRTHAEVLEVTRRLDV